MNENKKKLSLKDILILIFSVLIITFQCIIMIGQFTHECPSPENDVKTSLVERSRSNRKLDIIDEDLIIGDYSPTLEIYYPTISFNYYSAGLGDNFVDSYLTIGVFDTDGNYELRVSKNSGYISCYIENLNTSSKNYIARWSYDATNQNWDIVYGSDGYLGIIQCFDTPINFVPINWLSSSTSTLTIIDLGLLTTTRQEYNYYYDIYTFVSESQEAYSKGYEDGIKHVVNNPSDYDLVSKDLVDSDVESAYTEGLLAGIEQGKETGRQEGYVSGYSDGYNAYEEELLEDPESKGYVTKDYYDESVYIAEQDGIQSGKNQVINNPNNYDLYSSSQLQESFNKGVASVDPSLDEKGFKVLFNSILNAPYNLLNGILNFELFGVNVFNLLSFVFTLAVIGFVVKLLLTK